MPTMPQERTLPLKARVAVVIGNWLEFYDFIIYTFFAVMIGDAFFPGESDVQRLLGALATFGAGFLTRPIGAAVIGAYADRAGRRAALTLTLLLMALGSGMVALTPSYAQIGLAAPIILVVARLIQGFSAGGEVGPPRPISWNRRPGGNARPRRPGRPTASSSPCSSAASPASCSPPPFPGPDVHVGMASALPAWRADRARGPVRPPSASRNGRAAQRP